MANNTYTPKGNISIVGRISQEPTLRPSFKGDPICNFNLAVNEDFDDEETGDFGTKVTFYRIVVLEPTRAQQVFDRIKMGDMVAVAGRLQLAHSIRESDGMEFDQLEVIGERFNLKGNAIALTEEELTENERMANPTMVGTTEDEAQAMLDEARSAIGAA